MSAAADVPAAPGLLMIISAPSGAGKTTLARALLSDHEGVRLSVSHTTRPPRRGERHSVDYYFVDDERFDAMVGEGAFLEWAHVHANRYGTAREEVARIRRSGTSVLFDVDFQGGNSIMAAEEDAVSVFILPPSMAELERRIRGRAKDAPEVIERRLANARLEMTKYVTYDYVIVNDEFDRALAVLEGIYLAELHRRERMKPIADVLMRG